MKRRLIAAGTATLLLAGGLVGVSLLAYAAAAPNCVKVLKTGEDSSGYNYVDIRSDCKGYQRVKAIFAYGPDSSCVGVNPGGGWRLFTNKIGRFDGLVSC